MFIAEDKKSGFFYGKEDIYENKKNIKAGFIDL